MDTVTHGLIGYTLYQAFSEPDRSKRWKYALLTTAVGASQIPDIDVLAGFTEQGQIMEQMWHRGITHSIFLVPLWAIFLYGVIRLLFKEKDFKFFWLSALAVFIHDTIDLFNAWGTGYLEPFSSVRITLGYLPIVDLVIWIIFFTGVFVAHWKKWRTPRFVFQVVGCFIIGYIGIQSAQGFLIEQNAKKSFQETELSASFFPGIFQIIGKNGSKVEIWEDTLFTAPKKITETTSAEHVDLSTLFRKNPRAEVLYTWSPFVVIFENETEIGIYDPRFLRDGKSFLTEVAPKH